MHHFRFPSPDWKSLDWRYALRELVLIVAGILIALAINAAWTNRLNRQEERQALVRLQLEFSLNASRLRETRAEHEQIGSELRRLLHYVGPSGATAQTGTHPPDSLLSVLRDWWTFDPVRGTLNSLIMSGTLGLIQNDSLRIALAAWPDLVEDMNEDEREDRGAVRNHLIPLLYGTLQYRTLVDSSASAARDDSANVPERLDLLRSAALENWIVDRIIASDAVLREMVQVELNLQRIRESIAEELR